MDSLLTARQGWDWGPALLTCGPWRPVYIEVYESRISDLQVDTEIPESLDSAKLTVSVATEGPASKVTVQVSLAGKEVASKSVEVKDGVAVAELNVDKPELWYPVRYGGQPLYTVKATLSDGDDVDTCSKKVGLRRALLIQRPLKEQPGTSFFFEVNGVPVFCGGSNWIPADNFIPRITPQKYRDWLQLVADGNQFMVRVWGGGIYEEDAFYSACDELGLLVWQDFMFGCGNYPAWPELLASIRREAEANVRRLRHHPCIVIWAGNNEDYQFAESYSLTYDLADKDPDSWLQTNFPARYIYEKLLPDVCAELCPRTPYHFGSPYGGVDTRDPTVGDIHQWNVWHGTQERYQDFDALSGRFVSEFGMQALPCVKTIESFLPLGKDDPDRYAQSRTLDHHNKAAGHERRLALYLVENMCYSPNPLEQYVYATQLMQAECLASAYRLWKRQWKGPGREYCAGALVWQINDCWPVTSWAIADFYLRPKMAYFTVRREMAPLSVGITRKEHKRPKDKYTRADITVTHTVEVWGSNLGLDDLTGLQCVVRAWDVETGRMTFDEVKDADLVLPANRSTEITSLDVPGDAPAIQTVVAAYVVEKASGKQLARYVNWPEPLKYLRLQRPTKLRAELVHGGQGEGGAVVEVDAEVPVKGLVLESDEEGVKFTDNLVDVVPGETLRIAVHGATVGKTKIDVRYLGML